jgi:tetrahydrodipicolinate N-succinyltransferase
MRHVLMSVSGVIVGVDVIVVLHIYVLQSTSWQRHSTTATLSKRQSQNATTLSKGQSLTQQQSNGIARAQRQGQITLLHCIFVLSSLLSS